MRKIINKAITVLGSAALVGATVGMAAAAAYPEPFTSNTAIVVGANAAPSDSIAASSIAADLDASAVGPASATSTVSGGDSYKFEKSSTKFHIGDTITGVVSTNLDEDDMPVLLADGEYTDDNNDEFDYEQSISMAALQLVMFENDDYKTDEPTLGFELNSNSNILNYTFDFNEEPLIADLDTTDIMLMGKEYYVLSTTTTTADGITKLTLLDSASDSIVAEGETVTISAGGKTYTVGIEFVDSTDAKLVVNGEVTNKLATAETYKLDDGSYIGVKEVLYSAKDTGISKVEFSIGNGKLVLEDGQDVELNEDNVDDLSVTLVNSSDGTSMTSMTLQWDAEDDLFVTTDSQAVMPGFNTVQLAFGGVDYDVEENILLSRDGNDAIQLENFPLKDSVEDIPLLYGNGTHFVGIGKDADDILLTDADADGTIVFNDNLHTHFVVSWTDGQDAESFLVKAYNFDTDQSNNETDFAYRKDGSWVDIKTDRRATDAFDIGSAELLVNSINKDLETVNISANNAETSFNVIHSAAGARIYLPYDSATASGAGAINLTGITAFPATTSWNMIFSEEDEDGDINAGSNITATVQLVGTSPNLKTSVESVSGGGATATEIKDTEVFRNFVYSDLATEILHDQSDEDQESLELIYHGEEVMADVFVTSSDATVSSDGGDSGVMTVTDSEVASVAGKNLIVVGGSAINSVAAELLGGAYRTEEFTSMTGVGAGEFLIQSFDRGGRTALLVAGYHAADTTKAATYLINNDVDTDMGMKYEGTSATEASLVVA